MSMRGFKVQEIIEKTRMFVLEKYSKYNGKFGPVFMKMITEESIDLANKIKEGTNLNELALLLGIYLHDIGRVITDEEEHTIEGKKIAEIFLNENGVKDPKILEIVFDCILNHGSKAHPTSEEGKIVQFIDKAVLINPKIIKIYFELLLEKNDKNTAKETALTKLEKWYNSLDSRKKEFENQYKECLEYMNNLT